MSTWSIGFYPQARKYYSVLDSGAKKLISKRLKWLSLNFNRTRHESLHGPLQGHYKIRAGDYRLVYSPNYQKMVIEIEYLERRDKVYK